MRTLHAFFQSHGSFMPHGMCYLWDPELLWLHVISDGLVALAYFAIPPVLLYLVVRARRELKNDAVLGLKGLPFDWIFMAFGVFIVACGATHFLAVVTVWKPVYWVSGGVKAATAVASLATAVALPPFAPKALALIRAARENEHHRQELERAHDELRELNLRLREMDRIKSEFFANVSHELRTPLTLIVGPTQRMIEEGDLSPAQTQRAHTVYGSALRLVSMVDDLLEVTPLESGASMVRPSDLDLGSLVRRAAEPFREVANSRGVDLRVETPESLSVHLDGAKTGRALTNVLAESLRATPPGGRVRIAAARADGVAQVMIDDSGPPLPEGFGEHTLNRFRTGANSPSRRFDGTGLALSVARDFVEMQGGTLTATDSTLGGVMFLVTLPSLTTSHVEPATPDEDESPGAPAALYMHPPTPVTSPPSRWLDDDPRPRLLAVEEDEGMRAYLADALAEEFACACVADGTKALALALESPPAVVVTALSLPGMDGERFISRIRRAPATRDVPVLVLTARADPSLPARLLSGGAQDYLVKPVRSDELLARVRNLVAAASARATLKSALGGGHGDLPALSVELANRKRELEQAIHDKETLLQELHHRVKGNLQTVASLMNLQLRSLEDPVAREALQDSRSRIRAIALLHERLYQDGQPTEVDLAGYLRGLAGELSAAFRDPGSAVEIDIRVNALPLDVERAVACGLIAHELMVNALEHGLRDGAPAPVTLHLGQWDGSAVLAVQDHGPGLGAEVPAGGLGLKLVHSLTRQLRGTLRFDEVDGLRCEVRFPLVRRARRLEAL